MKTPYDFLVRLMPKPTAEDETAARSLGVDVNTYRAAKLEALAEQAKQPKNESAELPHDIATEEALANRLRRQPGLIKPRNVAPNILMQAAKTPGEVARTILFVLCYVIALAALVIGGGERVQKMPGIFQCVVLGVMIIPVWWISNRIWEAIGESARDVIRALVRFWPLTLILLVFILGILIAIKRQLLS